MHCGALLFEISLLADLCFVSQNAINNANSMLKKIKKHTCFIWQLVYTFIHKCPSFWHHIICPTSTITWWSLFINGIKKAARCWSVKRFNQIAIFKSCYFYITSSLGFKIISEQIKNKRKNKSCELKKSLHFKSSLLFTI